MSRRSWTSSPSSAAVSVRDVLHAPLGGIRRRSDDLLGREASSITTTVWNVTSPRHVKTSVVNKSAPANALLCARRKVCAR
jgi:hypothetical protein